MQEKKGAIILLCGLPGSGKTYLGQKISLNFMSYNSTQIRDSFLVKLSYDDYISTTTKDEAWKKTRQIFHKAIDLYIETLLSRDIAKTDNETLSYYKKLLEILPRETTEYKNYIFLLDDNFYYPSMRQEWYQTARKYGFGFGQILLKCDISLALIQNAQRSNEEKVPEHIIERMQHRAEWPDNKYHFIALNSNQTIETKVNESIKLIITTLNHPVQPVEDNTEEKELSRLQVSSNLIHQSDIILRKLVSDELNGKAGSCNFKETAPKISKIRQSILSKLRSVDTVQSLGLQLENLSDKLKVLFMEELKMIM